ncbi:RHS repeat-associated core domain-containing protein, partial [Sedimenticola hydrogenitrophicus]|uniref:RHS repeat-associated core domain-containing protein n=1 Tax=Sedimenticola hydrogenitrophicus TaxID=2967975 RepID=UPI0023AED99A
ETNQAWANPLRFPGQYYDAETGAYYNYFRDYDPSIGRYVQRDPIGLGGGLNMYAYVEANPLVKSDRIGLKGGHIRNQRNRYGSSYGKAYGINPKPTIATNIGNESLASALSGVLDMNFCDVWPAACTKTVCVKWRCWSGRSDNTCGRYDQFFEIPGDPVVVSPTWRPEYDPDCECIKWRWK